MRLITKLSVAMLACAALLAAGCGDEDKERADTAPIKQTAPTDPTGVSMKNIKFEPEELTVKVGDTVTWTNDEGVDHNVVAQEGADFKSDNFGQGGTYEFKATKAGTIDYTCTLHPGMDGTLEVTD